MEWKKLGTKIAKAAPLLGSLIGGPAGAAAGPVIELVASALGLDPAVASPDEIDDIISRNPEALVKLRQIETRHETELQKLVIESRRLELTNVADAWAREVGVTRATGRQDYQLCALAWIFVAVYFTLCFALMRQALPPASTEVIFMVFGSRASGFTMVLSLFFRLIAQQAGKIQLLADLSYQNGRISGENENVRCGKITTVIITNNI